MKLWIKILIGVTLLVTVVLVFAGNYFYNYAVVPSEKDFLEGDTPGTTKTNEESSAQSWFANPDNRKEWQQISTDGLKLSAIYLPATDSHKTAIVAHGYMGNAETMANYAKMFHDLGYNVLVPDARGHGKSEGDYIGFGWHERKDYVKWIDQVLETNGQSEEIVLYGISMGAATVMMTSGESLPTNVKAIIEDCGYSSVNEELAYQLNELFSLPPFPLIQVTSLMTKIRAGYFFGEADAIKQLEKNQLPMLFIHGDADTFVPYEMLDKVYQATNGPKEKYIVPGAEHAKAYSIDPENYQKTVSSFLEKYVK
ncbi:alpha/beta hydrolase [Enterococcus mundtii]|uniref:Hydrolase of the alpha, beta superfamily n=1 Tax=Enterococcus mundtii TaxID=53346 RepID=A0AAI8RC32_ENTMU|nr:MULTISPECIES: alpha/beta hydrolase [Enterococcus]EOH61684.1 X-Pro dipeptidyl-peptidase [Enterococcus mundtii ATCC 882]EOU12532.1 X-Pro dipeptidyl-peptidase [Enterococcus mundtii ATCC 882]PJK24757.1 alpha/beta hydrolase [Enterococcus mundtii]QCJ56269.1 alpha/beta hydrolase [Enterococcus mundtii]UBM06375.1 alpha/beta hydrolase [Enterococcus mundtii]